jgi:hypothetical protein
MPPQFSRLALANLGEIKHESKPKGKTEVEALDNVEGRSSGPLGLNS